jgi:hypothetical protein
LVTWPSSKSLRARERLIALVNRECEESYAETQSYSLMLRHPQRWMGAMREYQSWSDLFYYLLGGME